MSIAHLLTTREDGRATLTVFNQGEVHNITSTHPNFEEITAVVSNADAEYRDVEALINIDRAIRERLTEENLNERISIVNGTYLHIDGHSVGGEDLGVRMLALMKAGRSEDVTSLIRFVERAAENPGGIASINSLWSWLDARNVTFTEDGHFLAYKGVNRSEQEDVYLSVRSGDASVNGKPYKKSQIPQKINDIVTMPREHVNGDTKVGCSYGLHAGSWGYASKFASVVLAVSIDPADVVSVPSHAEFQKLRVCQYKVMAVVSSRVEEDEKEFFLPAKDTEW